MASRAPSEKINQRPDDSEASQTDWVMIFQAVRGEGESAEKAWNELARRYWPAIYAYIRSGGRDVHEASDLTQAFVCDVMVGRQLLASADPTHGRFRTLLLTALKNYIIEQHRRDTRMKRSPAGRRVFELDSDEQPLIQLDSDASPEAAFTAQWSATLIRRVLDQVRANCQEDGLDAHWTVFEFRVVRPMVAGDAPRDYSMLVDQLALKDTAQAANMMITVKRRFARALLMEISGTVGSSEEVEDELLALLRTLERSR